jgi:RND family efflux transporter MFP subunit
MLPFLAQGAPPFIKSYLPIVLVVGTAAAVLVLSLALLGLVVMLTQWRRAARVLVQAVLPLGIVAIAGWSAWWLVTTKPQVERARPEQPVTPVRVETARLETHAITVEGMGEVLPAQQVVLRPQVSGLVIELSPQLVPGGRFLKGDRVARIDSSDYDLAVEQAKTAVEQTAAAVEQAETAVKLAAAAVRQAETAVKLSKASIREAETTVKRAEAELALEQGRQLIAQREWSMLGKDVPRSDVSRDLALRKPQLRIAEAAVDAAKERLAAAKLDQQSVQLQLDRAKLEEKGSRQRLDSARLDRKRAQFQLDQATLNRTRTTITAPFNATVIREDVDLGQLVNPQAALATLIGTDRFWVQTAVPLGRLARLRLPDADGSGGSKATVLHATGADGGISHPGRLVRVLSDVDPRSRMARVLIEVEDPLRLKSGGVPLLTESFARVEIEGRPVADAAEIQRTALREGGRVWLMTDDGTLAVRTVEVAWRRKDTVLVRGLREGERVIDSSIAAPVPGMPLRIETAGATTAPAKENLGTGY